MLDPGRTHHHIPGVYLLHRLAPLLGQPNARCNHQSLTGGVGVPGRTCARVEADVCGRGLQLLVCWEQGIHPHRADEVLRRTGSG